MSGYKYPWTLPDSERSKAVCADCKAVYGTYQDMVIPDDLWLEISPFGDCGGLLCPTCIANRLDHIDKWYQTGMYIQREAPELWGAPPQIGNRY